MGGVSGMFGLSSKSDDIPDHPEPTKSANRVVLASQQNAGSRPDGNCSIVDCLGKLHRRWWGIASDLLEAAAVHDADMMPVANLDDSARGQCPKSPTDRRESDTDVFTNVRTVHGQMDFGCGLVLGDLGLFKQLQKHCKLGNSASLAEQKCVSLGLAQLLAQLAHYMKLQLRVLGKAAS